jgi:hypothetical protein
MTRLRFSPKKGGSPAAEGDDGRFHVGERGTRKPQNPNPK